MVVNIRTDRMPSSDLLEGHAQRRIQFALGRFSSHIRSVRLQVVDLNGPRGGCDKQCSIDVRGRGWQVRVEDVDSDAGAAVDRAADRTARAVARRLARIRESGRAAGA